jgi:hypothetical protein
MIFISLGIKAQTQNNIFDDSAEMSERKDNSDVYADIPEKEPEIAKGPGNPGEDPVPIDDYIPILLVVSIGIIVYHSYKNKTAV